VSKRKQLVIALYSLIAVHVVMLVAGLIAPYDYAVQNREFSFAPPTRIHFVDTNGKFHLRPFVYGAGDRFAEHGEERGETYPVRFLVRGAEYKIAGFWSATTHLFGVDEPAIIFLLGTDQYGRDQLSRLLRGGQITLVAGLLATTLSIGIGLLFGIIAGYYGRFTDVFVMRVAEVFMVLPWLYLLLGVKAFLPLNVEPTRSFLLVVAVIGIVGWARPARLIRGVVLTAKERNYVLAARGFGASDMYLLRRHILPQTIGVVLTQATLLAPRYSLSEMTLSFLGLGVGEPVPSWGNMLTSLQQYHVLTSYWWMFLPALPVIVVFWGYYTVASGLQELTIQ
jgi:peptide/nickel transport system permease protein